jgi:glycosyltransferase involved in cell wall biosynthesis
MTPAPRADPSRGAARAGRPLVMQLAATDYAFRVHLRPVARALARAGFDVVCAGPPGPFAAGLRAEGLPYDEVPLPRSANPLVQLRALGALVRLLRARRPDVLHTHTAAGGLVGRVAGRIARVPVVVHTIHGMHTYPGMPAPAERAVVAAERLGARLSHAVFTQNEEDRRVAEGWGVLPPDRVVNLGNGVDLRRFDPAAVPARAVQALRAELALPPDARVVAYVSRPTRHKGAAEVLALSARLAAHPGVYLVCLLPELPGERGSLRERFHTAPGGERRRVLGFRDDVPTVLALADLLVLPSRLEGLPRSVIEAMAMGRPVVASDVRGSRELVEDGATGFLVPPGDVDALEERVLRLLADPAARAAMGARARERALRLHDESRMLDAQVEVIRALVNARTAG